MSLRIGEAVASAYSFVVTQVIVGFVKEKYFKSLRLESEKKDVLLGKKVHSGFNLSLRSSVCVRRTGHKIDNNIHSFITSFSYH